MAGNIVPKQWTECKGQVLTTTHFPTLFYLLGNRYGGDGVTTFALPDLRGRIPAHAGDGDGLDPVGPAQPFGEAEVFAGEGAHTHAGVGLRYCICVNGLFPPPTP